MKVIVQCSICQMSIQKRVTGSNKRNKSFKCKDCWILSREDKQSAQRDTKIRQKPQQSK